MPDLTPSQTIGPFFAYALPFEGGERLVAPEDPDAIRIAGAVLDGDGRPVDDALVEVWQANRHGRYRHPEDTREDLPLEDGFTGFGRCPTDAGGRFAFTTVKPGAADGQAPHIAVCILARGLLRHLFTRIYFPDETAANERDPLLSAIEPPRRATLIARPHEGVLAFDVHLQGEQQTAFLDL